MRKFKGQMQRELTGDGMSVILKSRADIADLQYQIRQKLAEIDAAYKTYGPTSTQTTPGDLLLCVPEEGKPTDRVLYYLCGYQGVEEGSDEIGLVVRLASLRTGEPKGVTKIISPQQVDVQFPKTMFWHTVKTILNAYKLI